MVNRRGRPRLNLQATVVRFPPVTLAKIDAAAGGRNRRAAFVREAVEEALRRQPAPEPPADRG